MSKFVNIYSASKIVRQEEYSIVMQRAVVRCKREDIELGILAMEVNGFKMESIGDTHDVHYSNPKYGTLYILVKKFEKNSYLNEDEDGRFWESNFRWTNGYGKTYYADFKCIITDQDIDD